MENPAKAYHLFLRKGGKSAGYSRSTEEPVYKPVVNAVVLITAGANCTVYPRATLEKVFLHGLLGRYGWRCGGTAYLRHAGNDDTLVEMAARFVAAVSSNRLYPDDSSAYFVEREQASAILQSQ